MISSGLGSLRAASHRKRELSECIKLTVTSFVLRFCINKNTEVEIPVEVVKMPRRTQFDYSDLLD